MRPTFPPSLLPKRRDGRPRYPDRDSKPMSSFPETDWRGLLEVFLHDPMDKALDIRGHERRAARYLSKALGEEVSRTQIESAARLADPLAAVADRLPMPTAGPNGERAVAPRDGTLTVNHPISSKPAAMQCEPLDELRVTQVITEIVKGLETPRERFFALWRLLPERLEAKFGPWMSRLPADTRIPDHSLIHHADITAGLWTSRQGGPGAYLSFALGPVQPFIEAARSVRDLWSGSAILSWLAFAAMRPVATSSARERSTGKADDGIKPSTTRLSPSSAAWKPASARVYI